MNQAKGILWILKGLLLSIPVLLVIGLFEKNIASPHPSPQAQVLVPTVSTVAVEIIENGHPPRIVPLPVEHQTVPEISSLLLGPLALLLLLRRRK